MLTRLNGMKFISEVAWGRIFIASVILLVYTMLTGCNKQDIDRFIEQHLSAKTPVGDPVDRNFEDIKESGVLRIITSYSASTYFLHQGMDAGFSYELLNAFANEHDLVLQVVILGPDDDPQNLLNSGDGDVIATNYNVTSEQKETVNFTRPYNIVDQVVVYAADLEDKPKTFGELSESGLPVTARRNSPGYYHLNRLWHQGHDLIVREAPDHIDTESLLAQVADGRINAVITDDKTFHSAKNYMQGLATGPTIAEKDTIAWAVRKNSPELETQLNSFLRNHFWFTDNGKRVNRSTFLNILEQRYFEESPKLEAYYNPESNYSNVGLFSSYADLVKSTADSLDLNWLLLTSIIAQESNFNSESKSWAGAVGLMQILPRYSTTEYQHLYKPEINIREGAGIIKQHLDRYAYLDSLNQWSFALATYNAGIGHMIDARRLVMEQNRDPNQWENVADALLMLMQRRYYQHARYGYCHGIETVQYVKQVLNRYQTYKKVVSISQQRGGSAGL